MAEVQIGGGCSLGMVLFIVFLVLKLTGVIAWSWWYVTMPLWGPFTLFIVGGLLFLSIKSIYDICRGR